MGRLGTRHNLLGGVQKQLALGGRGVSKRGGCVHVCVRVLDRRTEQATSRLWVSMPSERWEY